MNAKDLRSLGKKELIGKLDEARKELVKLNAQVATGTNAKSPGQIKKMKKTVAKVLTVLREKGEVM